MTRIDLFKKRCKLIVAEDVWNVCGTLWSDIFGQYIRVNSDLVHIQSQLPYDPQSVLHRSMRFIWPFLTPYLYQFFGQNRFCPTISQAELVEFVK
jgi:hypothetical protein